MNDEQAETLYWAALEKLCLCCVKMRAARQAVEAKVRKIVKGMTKGGTRK